MTGSTVRAVVGPEEERLGAEDRAYVFAGGVVTASGGRVFLGSGGVCRLAGEGRVTLVEDGLRALLPELASPAVVATRGDVVADCGRAWIGPRARYRATGTADLWVAPGLTGELDDTRGVQLHLWLDVDPALAWERLQPDPAQPAHPATPTPPGHVLPVEPGEDPVAWLAPLVDRLEAAGGRLQVEQERRAATLTVTVGDPDEVLAAALREVRTPPTLRLLQRGDEGWSMLSHAVSLHVVRGRGARPAGSSFWSRLRGR